MTIRIDLTANPDTGDGVNFNTDLIGHFEGYVPYQMPVFLPEAANKATQILHLGTPQAGSEQDTRIILLDGHDLDYTFSNHSESGTINTIRLGRFGSAVDPVTGALVTQNGRITDISETITLSNLSISNPAGVKGDVHELVGGPMGGGLDGTDVDPQPILDQVWSQGHNLFGSTGNDTYTGTDHADIVRGAGGSDLLRGGAGADRFWGGWQ